jgi:glycosyltransferase involved in cell wall biosynthesis
MIALAYKQLFPHVPVFFTFHTDYLSPLAGSKKEILEAMLERCDSLIFTSSYLRLKTRNSLSFKAKSKVIYAGATGKPVSEREVQEFRKRHSLEDKFPVLLYMTPFVWEGKVVGIELLGKSLQSLRRQSLDPKLLVLGDGPLRGRTEERTRRLGFEDVVMFLGRLEDPWTAISACDVYTHISMKESLSMSILEAMSSGKPVIATDVGGTREIISDNSIGALVSPDSAEIEEAIFSLSSNRDRMREMGSKARKWIEARFTWDQSAKNHLKLYREAIDEA